MISVCRWCVREKEREGDGEIVEKREREREIKGWLQLPLCVLPRCCISEPQCVQNNSMVCICTQNLVNMYMYMYVVLYMCIVLHSHTVLIILCFRDLIPLFGHGSNCEILIILINLTAAVRSLLLTSVSNFIFMT